jgi:hypothetical protein
MTTRSTPARPALRITVYDLAPGMQTAASRGCCFVYAPNGGVILSPGGTLGADDGGFAEPGSAIRADAAGWIFEVAPAGMPFLQQAEIVRSQVVRPAFGPPFLVRADRIESPPGAATPRHGHRGPGMRRLVKGRLLAEIGDTIERLESGHAWFETGLDMVVGTNTGIVNAAFVRVMVLPVELEGGKSSFMAANEVEAAKPRLVMSRLFGETRLDSEESST